MLMIIPIVIYPGIIILRVLNTISTIEAPNTAVVMILLTTVLHVGAFYY